MENRYVRQPPGLLLDEFFDGRLELRGVIRRVDAFSCAAT
jgi:hypothetical protein